MKWDLADWVVAIAVLAIVLGLVSGCYALSPTEFRRLPGTYDPRESAITIDGETISIPATKCYHLLRHDIGVYATDACPDFRNVSAVITNYMERERLPAGSLDGISIVFTSQWIDCWGTKARGCAIRNGVIWVTLEGRAFYRDSWTDILAHELDHMDSFMASNVRRTQ